MRARRKKSIGGRHRPNVSKIRLSAGGEGGGGGGGLDAWASFSCLCHHVSIHQQASEDLEEQVVDDQPQGVVHLQARHRDRQDTKRPGRQA